MSAVSTLCGPRPHRAATDRSDCRGRISRVSESRCGPAHHVALPAWIGDRPAWTVSGYGAVSRPIGGQFLEIIEHRAWSKSEADGWPDARATYEHRDLLATYASGTLRFDNNSRALLWECDLPNTQTGNDVRELVSTGILRGASVEMQVYDDTYEWRNDMPLRHVNGARLNAISAVCVPAYPSATVALRHLSRGLARQFDADVDEIEQLLVRGECRSLFQRTDIQVAAPVTVPPTPKEERMDSDLAQRIVKNEAHLMAMHGDRRALDILQGKPPGGDIDLQRRILDLNERKARYDAEVIDAMARQRDAYQQPDFEAQHRQQQAEILALATRRRILALAEAGHDVPDTACGATTLHPLAGPDHPVATARQKEPVNGGWIGT